MNTKRLNKVKIEWSSPFSYAIGLITTDGNLSKDNRHINMTSKDRDLICTFKKCLSLKNRIGRKARGGSKDKKYFVVQFGDRNFYDFLLSIGLTTAKSKTLQSLNVPDKYFADFLRGCIDGDGSIGVYKHPESQHPQLRIRLCSASPAFLSWVKASVTRIFGIKSGWIENKRKDIGVLIYAKADSIKLLKLLYYKNVRYYLARKFMIAKQFMRV